MSLDPDLHGSIRFQRHLVRELHEAAELGTLDVPIMCIAGRPATIVEVFNHHALLLCVAHLHPPRRRR